MFQPIISFAGEVKNLDNISVKEYVYNQLQDINILIDNINFKQIGFSDEIANIMTNNKTKVKQALADVVEPILYGSEADIINSQFKSAGDYFKYIGRQIIKIKKMPISDFTFNKSRFFFPS